MSNNFSFVGRIGSDPELKDVGSSQVLEFSAADNTGFGDRKVTSWYRVALWGKRGVSLQPHLTKGKQVWISGQLTLRKYNDRDGNEKLSPEVRVEQIEFMGGNSQGGGNGGGGSQPHGQGAQQSYSPSDDQGDMPF